MLYRLDIENGYPNIEWLDISKCQFFLAILAECNEYDYSSSCYSIVGPGVVFLDSKSLDCSPKVNFGEVEALFCQCDTDDALIECLSCGLLFEFNIYRHGC